MTIVTNKRVNKPSNCKDALLAFMQDDPGWYSIDFVEEELEGFRDPFGMERKYSYTTVSTNLNKLYCEGKLIRRKDDISKEFEYSLAPPGTAPPTKRQRELNSGAKRNTGIVYTHCQYDLCGKELPPREKGAPGPPRKYCNADCVRMNTYKR